MDRSSSILTQIIDFFRELIASLNSGYLFFGSSWDLLRYAADILLVALLFYWILLFIKQTRAWQLIKGIVLILVFVLLCGLFGLEMVGFIFNRFLYVFAILFIVIFQPELRRALETVGLRSFGSVKSIFSSNGMEDKTQLSSFINEICLACREMAKSYTGALILIERNTRLDELLTQENVVKFNSTVSNSVLQSIFYKGSPMHDGGLLIRDGRIIAARCHVPLSVTMHSLERSGTRHRAAVGASEMGDTVAVVVSEERGKTSIAVNGKLYEMKNSKELEANLSYLLGLNEVVSNKKGFGKLVSRFKGRKKPSDIKKNSVSSDVNVSVTEKGGEQPVGLEIKTQEAEANNKKRSNFFEKSFLMLLSLILSFGLWMYIQINNNPVVSKSITVPITYNNTSLPDNIDVSYPVNYVDVEIVGRKETLDSINASDIVASIDYSAVTDTGVVELPIVVNSRDANTYFRVEQQVPETISVTIYSQSETQISSEQSQTEVTNSQEEE